ncbi:tRNA glutamyl-Q(34) synthetase GluQRS [Roseomonas frigidaquae]|uniref:tRNA glutamyl-Q(34) synthetase GluQRS n=1 Tax=Falsiroseomonas frigidaquae TaxID=487318 RepID=A0ABX1F348_9PROT|nr:tRNA glutamyl-Q(34) synthetase GluQRS [Falsiroseomonas frigidaquae]NKE46791.1 tRNA glutamyl-Q(34) synthetase GluQRS [Falsiroseomonas frigidaquae]
MTATRPPVTRFAPSPTGFLHLGHAHAALVAWRTARQGRGRFLLRIEDIDSTRCRPEFTEAILEDLRWLGLDWDGPVRIQSRHMADYRRTLLSLRERGLLFPCFCTRSEIAREIAASASAPHGPDGPLYPGICLRLPPAKVAARLASGEPHALRLNMSRALACLDGPLTFEEATRGRIACNPAQFGDVVLARKEVPASYHLCVTHDDAEDGVTLVTRGEDLLPATDLHRLLQRLMNWPEPRYAHHPLLADAAGRRLSKRDGAPTLRDLSARGASPAEVRALAGFPD